ATRTRTCSSRTGSGYRSSRSSLAFARSSALAVAASRTRATGGALRLPRLRLLLLLLLLLALLGGRLERLQRHVDAAVLCLAERVRKDVRVGVLLYHARVERRRGSESPARGQCARKRCVERRLQRLLGEERGKPSLAARLRRQYSDDGIDAGDVLERVERELQRFAPNQLAALNGRRPEPDRARRAVPAQVVRDGVIGVERDDVRARRTGLDDHVFDRQRDLLEAGRAAHLDLDELAAVLQAV